MPTAPGQSFGTEQAALRRVPIGRILTVIAVILAFVAGFAVATRWRERGNFIPRAPQPGAAGQAPRTTHGTSPKPSPSPSARAAARAGPSKDLQARLNQIGSEIQTLDSSSEKSQLTELQNEVDQKQAEVNALESQLINQSAGQVAEIRNEELRRQQQAAAAQDTAAHLRNQIQVQNERVRALQLQIAHTVAPPDSDLMVGLRAKLDSEQKTLAALQTRYTDVVQAEQAGAQESYDRATEMIQAQQAAEQEARSDYQQSKSELAELQDRAEKLKADIARKDGRIQELEAERSVLMQELTSPSPRS